MYNFIYIHIPKSGGTTLLIPLFNISKPPNCNFYYRHITLDNINSNCGDIFLSKNIDLYKNYKLILTLRDPLERLESEYSFLKNRLEWTNRWNKKYKTSYPNTLLEYISNSATYNSIIKFLLGYSVFDNRVEINESHYNHICNILNSLDVIYGITENMSSSIKNISYVLNKEFPKSITLHRKNLNKLERDDNWENIKNIFNENNKWDNKLYEFVNNKFKLQIKKIPKNIIKNKLNFKGDEYIHLIIYTNPPVNRSPICIFNPDSAWIKKNINLLQEINNSARSNAIKQYNNNNTITAEFGRLFTIEWCKIIIKKLDIDFKINISNPLETVKEISNFIHKP